MYSLKIHHKMKSITQQHHHSLKMYSKDTAVLNQLLINIEIIKLIPCQRQTTFLSHRFYFFFDINEAAVFAYGATGSGK